MFVPLPGGEDVESLQLTFEVGEAQSVLPIPQSGGGFFLACQQSDCPNHMHLTLIQSRYEESAYDLTMLVNQWDCASRRLGYSFSLIQSRYS